MTNKRTATINARVTPANKEFLNTFAADMGFSSSRLVEHLIETLKEATNQQKAKESTNATT